MCCVVGSTGNSATPNPGVQKKEKLVVWVLFYLFKATKHFVHEEESVQVWYPIIDLFKELLKAHWAMLQALFKERLPPPKQSLEKVIHIIPFFL